MMHRAYKPLGQWNNRANMALHGSIETLINSIELRMAQELNGEVIGRLEACKRNLADAATDLIEADNLLGGRKK
jgi:hypothetical protein